MEGREGAAVGDVHFLEAVSHFLGGFIGEGDGEDVSGVYAILDEMGDTVGDDACFSAAGSGEDEHGAIDVGDGATLRFGEVFQKVVCHPEFSSHRYKG